MHSHVEFLIIPFISYHALLSMNLITNLAINNDSKNSLNNILKLSIILLKESSIIESEKKKKKIRLTTEFQIAIQQIDTNSF